MEILEKNSGDRDDRSEDLGCESKSFSEFGEERRESNSSTGVSNNSISAGSQNESFAGPEESLKEEMELLGWRMRSGSVSGLIGNEKKLDQKNDKSYKPPGSLPLRRCLARASPFNLHNGRWILRSFEEFDVNFVNI